jgi:hypothetical protein
MSETNQQTPAEPLPQLAAPTSTPAASVYANPPTTNAWAIISLVSSILGWLGLFGIGGIIGVVTGLIARNEIAASRGAQTGEGMALVGIILGAINIIGGCLLALCIVMFAVGLPLLFMPFAEGW